MPDQAPDSDAKVFSQLLIQEYSSLSNKTDKEVKLSLSTLHLQQHGIFEFGAIIMTTCVITVNIKVSGSQSLTVL